LGATQILKKIKAESKENRNRSFSESPWYARARQAVLGCAEPYCGERRVPHLSPVTAPASSSFVRNMGLLEDADDLLFDFTASRLAADSGAIGRCALVHPGRRSLRSGSGAQNADRPVSVFSRVMQRANEPVSRARPRWAT
jgi:hypothetical protein